MSRAVVSQQPVATPLRIKEDSAELLRHRVARAPGPFFLVSISTIPGVRSTNMVLQSIISLLQQSRVPDCILEKIFASALTA